MQKNVLEYLEHSARVFADKVAYTDGDFSVTFSKLREYGMAVGCDIHRKTGVIKKPIAVITDRSVFPVIAFTGVLYSGNCYVPIDSKMPKARMDTLIRSLAPSGIVYQSAFKPLVADYEKDYVCIELDKSMNADTDESVLCGIREKIIDLDPVYIIFTSGSTGTPKGIVISHRSVIDFTDWYVETMGIDSTDILGNQAPFYFDLSVKDLYTALKSGATAHILPQKFFMFPVLLTDYIEKEKITTLSWATSAFHLVANSRVLEKHAPNCIKRVILGGEALQAKRLNMWRTALPDVQYVNLYGPTEVTVDCTYYFIDREFADTDTIPIGKPCINKEIILLDENRKPVADGETGEICVRGSGIALGYYGDRQKTDTAFIQNPENPYYNDILYCTGDIAYRDTDGNLRFVSRKDHQIKHGGYRIELGEIETAVNGISGVDASVCIFDEIRDKIVCIYEGTASGDGIAKEIRSLIPKYMMPNIYHKRDKMPYTGGGKLDRVRVAKEYHETDN